MRTSDAWRRGARLKRLSTYNNVLGLKIRLFRDRLHPRYFPLPVVGFKIGRIFKHRIRIYRTWSWWNTDISFRRLRNWCNAFRNHGGFVINSPVHYPRCLGTWKYHGVQDAHRIVTKPRVFRKLKTCKLFRSPFATIWIAIITLGYQDTSSCVRSQPAPCRINERVGKEL